MEGGHSNPLELNPYRTEHVNQFGKYTLNLARRDAAPDYTLNRLARVGVIDRGVERSPCARRVIDRSHQPHSETSRRKGRQVAKVAERR